MCDSLGLSMERRNLVTSYTYAQEINAVTKQPAHKLLHVHVTKLRQSAPVSNPRPRDIGILYSDGEFMDLTPSLILAPLYTIDATCILTAHGGRSNSGRRNHLKINQVLFGDESLECNLLTVLRASLDCNLW